MKGGMNVNKSFEELLEQYSDMVTRICIMNLRNTHDAKDCYQNVFIKLFKNLHLFQDEDHVKHWLIRVTMNECHTYRRLFYKPTIDIDEVMVGQTDQSPQLLPVLWTLPEKQRNILYLYYYEGYHCQEIAQLLNMKENTIKSHLRRGRMALKERLGEYDESF